MSQEEFDRQLKEQNLSMEALREESKKDLAVQKLQDKYAGKVTISDREVEDYYNANKQVFVNARGAGLAVIIVDPADNSNQGIMDDAKNDADAKTKQAESILAHLYPIEQAIMATPAHTIVGLGVKARHAAYVMSQYWEAPIDQIDWDTRAARLLIEAVCEVARMPLPFTT